MKSDWHIDEVLPSHTMMIVGEGAGGVGALTANGATKALNVASHSETV
jgi:hypothetical protein